MTMSYQRWKASKPHKNKSTKSNKRKADLPQSKNLHLNPFKKLSHQKLHPLHQRKQKSQRLLRNQLRTNHQKNSQISLSYLKSVETLTSKSKLIKKLSKCFLRVLMLMILLEPKLKMKLLRQL